MALPGKRSAPAASTRRGDQRMAVNDIRRYVGAEELPPWPRSADPSRKAPSGRGRDGRRPARAGSARRRGWPGRGRLARWSRPIYGGRLTIAGVPTIGTRSSRPARAAARRLDHHVAGGPTRPRRAQPAPAGRAMLGLGRTGSSMSNGSGDYAIAFSVAPENAFVPAKRCERPGFCPTMRCHPRPPSRRSRRRSTTRCSWRRR